MRRIFRAGLALCGALTAWHPARAADPVLTLPPYTAAYEPRTVDERGLWMEADEHERLVRDSSLRIRDEKLEAYLRGVLCREVGADRCSGVRVYIMEIPFFNASMMTNGALEIWSGLLLRARDEGELAAVLGHEFAHFELRHGLAGFKKMRGTANVVAWLAVLGQFATTPVAGTQMSLIGSYYRFNRDQEAQADLLGLKYLAASGYPAQSAPAVWESVVAEDAATAMGRKQSTRRSYMTGFFDTHPASPLRATYLAEAAASLPAGGDARAQAYQDAIAPWLPRLLEAQVKLNDFGGSDYILSNLANRSGWTGDLLFARGELYRIRGNPRDLQLAAQFYGQAKAAGNLRPDLDRNMGLALLRNGQAIAGRQALKAYLAAQPDAADAKAIAALASE